MESDIKMLNDLMKADQRVKRINNTISKKGIMNEGVAVALGDAEYEAGVIARALKERGYKNKLIDKYL